LPQAIAAANQFGAKLAFLSIVPAIGSDNDEHSRSWQEDTRMRTLERLSPLADNAALDLTARGRNDLLMPQQAAAKL